MIKSTWTPKMKSIIVVTLLLALVLVEATSEDDEFRFEETDPSLSSVAKSHTGVLSKNYAEQLPVNPRKNQLGLILDDHEEEKYIISKNERKKKRLNGGQRKIRKNVKKVSKNGKLKKEYRSSISHPKKNYAIDAFRDRREAGSGYGEGDNYDIGDEYDDDENDPGYDDINENDPAGITDLPIVANESKSRGFVDNNQNPHRHGHGDEYIAPKAQDEINEKDIIPVISPGLEEGMKNIMLSLSTTPAPKLTTTPQTTTQQSSSTTSTTSLPTTTTTTLSTSTSTTTPSTTTLFVLSTSPFVETTMLQSNTNDTAPLSSTTTTSEETTKTDIFIPETTSMSNKIDDDNDNDDGDDNDDNELSIVKHKDLNDTLSTTLLTTLVNTVSTSTEKQEIIVITDEIPESTELPNTPAPEIILEGVETRVVGVGVENETETSTTASTTTTTTTTTVATTSTTTIPSTTTITTTTESPSSTTASTTPEPKKIDYGVRNYPPRQERRLQKIPIVAGKLLSFKIPSDTFNDIEDGDTRNLKLSLFYNGSLVKSNNWLQLNSTSQEIYGLPLENDVSIWQYVLVASDREGLNVSENLDIHVQQHSLSRAITFDFSIYLRLDRAKEFATIADWRIKIVKALASLYDNNSMSDITVRSIDETAENEVIFTWTNDTVLSLRTDDCPSNEINKLYLPLTDTNDDDPSPDLIRVLSPKIHVTRVLLQGFGRCDMLTKSETESELEPQVPTSKPKENGYPILRNHIDHINVTVGQLLVFKVPRDTFWDPEDGSGTNMKMALYTSDRKSLEPGYWLQFDSKNQEFYGIPLEEDLREARREYQLEATDKDGETAIDGLVVQVYPAEQKNYSIEFSMTLDVQYESFASSALQKRTFIEKLAKLFNDKNTSMISLKNIKKGSTIVTWRNVTLRTDQCPDDDIKRIMSVLLNTDYTVSEVVGKIMGDEFPVSQINRIPLGTCFGRISAPIPPTPPALTPTIPPSRPYPDDFFIKIILPAIIVATMILFAGIIALVLYRRRRCGKMSICEHDDERQSFRSKGIPVIFQDELEEKPDPGNKSPVILKEEKPPLPPPEYQKSDDGADEPMLPKGSSEEPYQPPPPFARNSDNNRQNRPKPTPTYRKPPPYVPP